MRIIPLNAGLGGGYPAAEAPSTPPVPAEDQALLDAYSLAVIDVVDRVGPAVVGLAVRSPAQPSPARRGGQERARGGTGSGVVVAPDGLILTNSHVAGAAGAGAYIAVTTADGQTVTAGWDFKAGTPASLELPPVVGEKVGMPLTPTKPVTEVLQLAGLASAANQAGQPPRHLGMAGERGVFRLRQTQAALQSHQRSCERRGAEPVECQCGAAHFHRINI